jgi:hypothetical protein
LQEGLARYEIDAGRVQFRGPEANIGDAIQKTKRAKARAADLAPTIAELRRSAQRPLRAMAAGLNERGIPTARGGEWIATQVMWVMARAT